MKTFRLISLIGMKTFRLISLIGISFLLLASCGNKSIEKNRFHQSHDHHSNDGPKIGQRVMGGMERPKPSPELKVL